MQEYDHLNRLFYRVLNRPVAERGPREQAEFGRVPYLNSTLFEPAALEQASLRKGVSFFVFCPAPAA